MTGSTWTTRAMAPLTLALLLVSVLACGRSTPVVTTAGPEAPPAGEATPTQVPLGSSRFNPAPPGSAVHIDEMTLVVAEVVYPADETVRAGNLFNPTPQPLAHYLFVHVQATCGRPAETSCRLSGLEFSVVDSDGVGHNLRPFLAGVAGKFEGGEFFGGATREGYLIFEVPEGDDGLLLKYQALFGGEAYFALD